MHKAPTEGNGWWVQLPPGALEATLRMVRCSCFLPENSPIVETVNMATTKTVCPVSRKVFVAKAGELKVEIGGRVEHLPAREFQTGSVGWNYSGKVEGLVDDGWTRGTFLKHAKGLRLTVGGITLYADAREFSSGGVGWYANDKLTITVDGKLVKCTVGVSLSVVGSKEASPKDKLDHRVQVSLNVIAVGSKELDA